jgi:uncharacterized protein (TIRG00374 family)
LKRLAITILKYAISLGILAWLFWRAASDEATFATLRNQPKNWSLLLAGLIVFWAALTSTIMRWWMLVRALKMPFTLAEALRLGYMSFLFTFLTLGVVGGDLVKAIFLARKQHGRRTEAVATIVIDRLIGLYALFVVASIGILSTDLSNISVRDPAQLAAVRTLCWVTVGLAIAGTIGIIVVALPTFGTSPLWEALQRVPRLGPIVERVTTAIKIYRNRPGLMGGIGVMSLATHCLFVLSVYAVARGLYTETPTLGMHFVVVPIAMVANTLPLPGGIGAFEASLDFLYAGVSPPGAPPQQGFVVALGYRFCTLLVALIGVVFYLTRRREVSQLIRAAQDEEQQPTPAA